MPQISIQLKCIICRHYTFFLCSEDNAPINTHKILSLIHPVICVALRIFIHSTQTACCAVREWDTASLQTVCSTTESSSAICHWAWAIGQSNKLVRCDVTTWNDTWKSTWYIQSSTMSSFFFKWLKSLYFQRKYSRNGLDHNKLKLLV